MTTEPISPLHAEAAASPIPNCGNCRFAIRAPDQPILYCRRFPPTPFLTSVTRHEETKAITGNEQLSVQPVVSEKNWCGEHIAMAEKLN